MAYLKTPHAAKRARVELDPRAGSFTVWAQDEIPGEPTLFLTSWGLLLRFQPYANQSIMCCVMVLTGIGAMMIARIDQDTKTSVAFRQLIWLSITLVLANLLIVFMRDTAYYGGSRMSAW